VEQEVVTRDSSWAFGSHCLRNRWLFFFFHVLFAAANGMIIVAVHPFPSPKKVSVLP
jgi:hypothetical protein